MSGRPTAIRSLPAGPGVYRFRDARGRPLYVGRAAHLRSRVGSYWGDLGDRWRLRPMVARITRIEAVACDSEHEAAWLERNLLERAKPRWNRTAGGAEVPVYIRLDERAGSPGLAVVHEPDVVGPGSAAGASDGVRHFGPYLGGLRVRLAVAALQRVLPLAYAADGLRGAARDMARARGVEPGDREALVRAVAGVLDRDPSAVGALREELARRRDAAAGELAFERAARIQSELAALDWVVAEQKVTRAEPAEFDVLGWAGGVLVRFEVRAGRVRTWAARACGEAAGRRAAAATPTGWAAFAQRNAELAARLLQDPHDRSDFRGNSE